MIKILFICHGSICRSPMAEYVMKDMVKKAGYEGDFLIASAATSREELGNPVYPPARRKLAEHGIDCQGHEARQMTAQDGEKYDLLVGMDRENLRNMKRICPDNQEKCHLLMDYADLTEENNPVEDSGKKKQGSHRDSYWAGHWSEREVADPWYTGDFDATWRDITAGCQGLLKACLKGRKAAWE